jgi:hypothetical protein
LIAVLGLVCGVGSVGLMLGRRQLPPSSVSPRDRRLAEQVEMLEEELRRVKDQADFTERLLTERDSAERDDAGQGDSPD